MCGPVCWRRSTPVTSTIIAVTVAIAALRFLSMDAWAGVAEQLALANFARR
jgi:hypothetical protein